MNWEAISAVSELLGAAAVILSLVFIAREIRLNTNAEKAATRHSIAETIMNAPLEIVASGKLAGLMHRSFAGEELRPDELLRLEAYCYATLRNWENIHYQFRAGMLTAEEWRAFRLNLKFLLQTGLWGEYWRREQDIYTAPFRDEVDALLRELQDEPRHLPDSLVFPRDDTA
jgi:hypothetical protein